MAQKPGLDAAYGLDGVEDNRRLYADWAGSYDSGFARSMDYALPGAVAQAFLSAKGAGPVLDVGAGTGLCGAALNAQGIGPLDALDLSQEMLEEAHKKGIFRDLIAGNLLERLPIDDATYAGAVSSGTFTMAMSGRMR